jgi:hypothetical protein
MIDQTTTENQPSVTDERIDFSETATRVRGGKEAAAGCRGGTASRPLSRLDVGGTLRQRLKAIRASGTEARQYTYHIEPPQVGGARFVKCTECSAEGVPADPERLSHHEGCSEGSR